MRIKGYWLFIFLGLTLAAFFFYQQTQPPLSYDFTPEFDGNDYRNIYDYFQGYREDYKVPHPFHQRILVPFLASLIGSDIIPTFQWVNLLFSLLAVAVLFLLWRDLGFELKWFWAGFTWLIFHWTGMIRLNAFDPITVDLPTYVFQALFLWLVLKRKFVHLLWLAPLATIQKESFIALPVLLFIYGAWHDRKTKEGFYDMPLIVASIVLAVAAQSIVNYNFPPSEEGKSAFVTLAYHAKEAILHPFELIRWLAAMSMAFGPALWLAFNHYRKTNRYDNTRNLLLIYSCLYLAFGILAGGDMTRIIFLGFPFIATWIIYELQEINRSKLLLLGLLSLPLTFIWKTLPDPAWQWEAWESWYPEFASEEFVLLVLGYCLVVTLLMNMKKTALIGILLMIPLYSCAQKGGITRVHIYGENRYGDLIDGMPKKDTLITVLNEKGILLAKGRYAVSETGDISNIMVGEWTYYNETGQIKTIGNYKLGLYTDCGATGPFHSFYPYRDGIWRYFKDDGEADFEISFIPKTHKINTNCSGGGSLIFGFIEKISPRAVYEKGIDYFYELQKVIIQEEMDNKTMTPLNGQVYVAYTMNK